jgi:hypothetical protein
MGQRNSIGGVFPFSLLKDIGSCFLLIGLNETHPAQMDNSLGAQMEKEQ